MTGVTMSELVTRLNDAANWKDRKPYRDAELFREAAVRIAELEAQVERLKAQ